MSQAHWKIPVVPGCPHSWSPRCVSAWDPFQWLPCWTSWHHHWIGGFWGSPWSLRQWVETTGMGITVRPRAHRRTYCRKGPHLHGFSLITDLNCFIWRSYNNYGFWWEVGFYDASNIFKPLLPLKWGASMHLRWTDRAWRLSLVLRPTEGHRGCWETFNKCPHHGLLDDLWLHA